MRNLELVIAAAQDPILDLLVKSERTIAELERRLAALECKLADMPKPEPGPPGRDGAGIDSPGWQEGEVYREGAFVTHYLGQYFKALKDTADEPGESAHWQRIGFAGIRWRGVREEGMEYRPGDQFLEESACFLVDHTGAPRLVNYRGERGARGKEGLPGKPGPAFEGAELAPLIAQMLTEMFVKQVVPTIEEIGERLVALERGRP